MASTSHLVTSQDIDYLNQALTLAKEAAGDGNLPIGALIVKGGKILARSGNKVLVPEFHPGRHAEIEALNQIPGPYLHEHSRTMTLYTTQEPCVMCLGAIVLYRIGRVIFGGLDPKRGASYLRNHLTQIYREEDMPLFIGPVMPEVCDALFETADRIYRNFRDSKESPAR